MNEVHAAAAHFYLRKTLEEYGVGGDWEGNLRLMLASLADMRRQRRRSR